MLSPFPCHQREGGIWKACPFASIRHNALSSSPPLKHQPSRQCGSKSIITCQGAEEHGPSPSATGAQQCSGSCGRNPLHENENVARAAICKPIIKNTLSVLKTVCCRHCLSSKRDMQTGCLTGHKHIVVRSAVVWCIVPVCRVRVAYTLVRT